MYYVIAQCLGLVAQSARELLMMTSTRMRRAIRRSHSTTMSSTTSMTGKPSNFRGPVRRSTSGLKGSAPTHRNWACCARGLDPSLCCDDQ